MILLKKTVKKIIGPKTVNKIRKVLVPTATKNSPENGDVVDPLVADSLQRIQSLTRDHTTSRMEVLVTDRTDGGWLSLFQERGLRVVSLSEVRGHQVIAGGSALTLNHRFLSAVHTELSALGQISALVVDVERNEHLGVQIAKELGGHVTTGGILQLNLSSQSPEDVTQFVAQISSGGYRSLSRMFSIESHDPQVLRLRKLIPSLAKTREYDSLSGGALERSGIQRVLTSEPGYTFGGRARLFSTDSASNKRFKAKYDVPEMCLRVSTEVSLLPGQIAFKDRVLLPESFRHPFYGELDSRHLVSQSHFFSDQLDLPNETEHLQGDYFLLDSEVQNHFGHVLTEQLPRLWCLDELYRVAPDVRFLVSPKEGADRLSSFEYELFASFGIESDRITVFNRPVTVENLYSATSMFSNPNYVDLRLSEVFDRAGAAVDQVHAPAKVFIARKPGGQRSCHNADLVEQTFRDAGYAIVFPEDLTIAEQISLFRNVQELGGYGGSGMLTALFCPGPIKMTVVASKSYTAVNEYMIAELGAHEIGYFWCEPDIQQPDDHWSEKAFMSDFRFDQERDLQTLVDWLTD